MSGPLRFWLDQLDDLTTRKNEGYAGAAATDPWANYRGATAFGLSALDSALCRFNEKHNRAAVLYSNRGEDRVGESLRDTLMDAAAIALIAVALLDEVPGRLPATTADLSGTGPYRTLDSREADHYNRWLAERK